MIPLRRPRRPAIFAGAVAAPVAQVQLAIASGLQPDWATLPETWKRFKAELLKAQHGKCAYCEFVIAGGSHGDVDHFRPKGAVDEMNVLTTSGDPGDRQLARAWPGGYWWRAYDWKNLVVACEVCNQIWKGAVFPARTRAGRRHRVPPNPQRRETPLLLNPFDVKDVRPHLSFAPLGQPIALSPQGQHTVAACGLFRPGLSTQRARLRAQVTDLLSIVHQGTPAAMQTAIDLLIDLGADHAPHAGAVRSYYETATQTRWPPQASSLASTPAP